MCLSGCAAVIFFLSSMIHCAPAVACVPWALAVLAASPDTPSPEDFPHSRAGVPRFDTGHCAAVMRLDPCGSRQLSCLIKYGNQCRAVEVHALNHHLGNGLPVPVGLLPYLPAGPTHSVSV
jgi:hypothetical protein